MVVTMLCECSDKLALAKTVRPSNVLNGEAMAVPCLARMLAITSHLFCLTMLSFAAGPRADFVFG